MIPQKILSFIVKSGLYLAVFLGLFIYSYMQRNSPTQPDPATGHVFPVTAPRSRRLPRHTLYLTSSERSLYHASFIVIAAGTVSIIGLALIRKRNRATPLS
jgi:hypothetical protein